MIQLNSSIATITTVGLSVFNDTFELSKISSWLRLLRFDKYDVSTTVEILVAENILSCELIKWLLKSIKGISCIERDEIWTFDFEKKS